MRHRVIVYCSLEDGPPVSQKQCRKWIKAVVSRTFSFHFAPNTFECQAESWLPTDVLTS